MRLQKSLRIMRLSVTFEDNTSCDGRRQEKLLEKNRRMEGTGTMQMYVASKQQNRKSVSYVRKTQTT